MRFSCWVSLDASTNHESMTHQTGPDLLNTVRRERAARQGQANGCKPKSLTTRLGASPSRPPPSPARFAVLRRLAGEGRPSRAGPHARPGRDVCAGCLHPQSRRHRLGTVRSFGQFHAGQPAPSRAVGRPRLAARRARTGLPGTHDRHALFRRGQTRYAATESSEESVVGDFLGNLAAEGLIRLLIPRLSGSAKSSGRHGIHPLRYLPFRKTTQPKFP